MHIVMDFITGIREFSTELRLEVGNNEHAF